MYKFPAKILFYCFVVFVGVTMLAYWVHYRVVTPPETDLSRSHVTIGGATPFSDVAGTEGEGVGGAEMFAGRRGDALYLRTT